MRVLQIVNTLNAADGGPARNSFELNQALNDRHDTTAQLWSIDRRESLSTPIADVAQGRVLIGPKPVFGESVFRLLLTIRESDTVIVHGFYLWWVPLVFLMARFTRKPVVVMPHGAVSSYEFKTSNLKKRVFDRILRLTSPAKIVFAVGSTAEAVDVRQVRQSDHVEVVGVGTRFSGHSRRARADETAEISLLSVSRIAQKKRIDLMIDAVAELSASGVAARLTIAGDGDHDLRLRLESQAASLGVTDQVAFIGHVGPREKDLLFQSSDIFLLPSEDENFGIGLAEALSRGLPAVVSDRVAAAHVVSSIAARRLHKPTGRTIAAAVADLIPLDSWNSASEAAWSESREAFDWARIAENWYAVLAARLNEGAPRTSAKHESTTVRSVVYVSTSYPSYSETFVSAEMDALERAGWQVTSYSLRKPPAQLTASIRHVCPPIGAVALAPWVIVGLILRWTTWRRTPRLRRARTFRALARSLFLDAHGARLKLALKRRGDVAGLHAHFLAQPAEVAVLAAGSIPVAVTVHAADSNVENTPENRRFVRQLAGLRFASEAVERTYRRLGVPVKSTVLPCVAKLPMARQNWTPDPNLVRIITVARLVETKGYRRMMALIKLTSARHPVDWTIVGDGAMRAEIEAWRKDAEGPNLRVNLTGSLPQDQTLELLSQSDVFLLLPESTGATLTRGDGLPVALMEAMACGVPIVSSNAGAIPELVEHGITGTLIDAVGDEGAVEALLQAGRDLESERLVAGGLELIDQRFSTEKTAKALDSWLHRIFDSPVANLQG